MAKNTARERRNKARRQAKSPFKSGTGLLGGTELGQKVNSDNIRYLLPGSVIRNGDGSRIIHLHDNVWLHCSDSSWCYDYVERMEEYLDKFSVACHVAPPVS